ncbi:MAG TPA: hypothetical protein ENJ09_07950 [Planctomycetes bacterium]|nr:hypothetical protein [Planctomycetota bacterium]
MKIAPLYLALIVGALTPLSSAQQINVEIDYMVDSDHSHMPSSMEIAAVVDMFARQGYALNVVVDDAIPHTDILRCNNPGSGNFFTCTSRTYTTFKEIKDSFFDSPSSGWHYCVFGHQYDDGNGTSSSGIAELGGNDLLVTLGDFSGMTGTPFDRAATFAHELGHNLGLRHFSPNSGPVVGNYAPNYASVMSYQYQLRGVKSQMECLGLVDQDHLFRDLDYSSGLLPGLLESTLAEKLGVGIHKVDWDCDGALDLSSVAQDLDNAAPWCASTSLPIGFLSDYNDWANIQSNADSPQVINDLVELETITCITAEEARDLQAASPDSFSDPTLCTGGSSPTLSIPPWPTGRMIWVDPNATAPGLGTGDSPYTSLSFAVSAAPPGSVLYLQPGTYTNQSGSILMDQSLVLAGPGGAVIDP